MLMLAKNSQTKNDYIKCFGLLIVMLLPVVGIVATIIFLFSAKKDSQIKTLSRAVLLIHLCCTIIFVSLFFAAGAFMRSLKQKYPQLEKGYSYATAFMKNGVDGVIDKMSENGELDKLLTKIDIEKMLSNADLSELLEKIDTEDLLEIIDTEAIMEHFNIDDVVLDSKKLLSIIESDKLMQYIDFSSLIKKVNEKELREILDNQKDK